jgi:hypothetical protein
LLLVGFSFLVFFFLVFFLLYFLIRCMIDLCILFMDRMVCWEIYYYIIILLLIPLRSNIILLLLSSLSYLVSLVPLCAFLPFSLFFVHLPFSLSFVHFRCLPFLYLLFLHLLKNLHSPLFFIPSHLHPLYGYFHVPNF